MLKNLRQMILRKPLLTVLLVAAIPRIVAAVWSQGFLHSDDYYDTVMIAHDWLRNGLFHEDGYLRWRHLSSSEIGRSPLYNLCLWAAMKALSVISVESLAGMMYVIRGLHALLSLAAVWACYRIIEIVTHDRRWALGVGLYVGLNFALPFLGVRNLIEVVGGNLWILALFALYRWRDTRPDFGAFIAGVISGLAWMVRFQLAFAIIPIPFALWYERKSVRPALWFCAGVGVMMLFSGLLDLALLGELARSTVTNLRINYGLAALYNMSPALYPLILLLLLVPPLSFLMVWNVFRKPLWREHLPLLASSFSFLVAHLFVSNRQERFILSIATAFMLAGSIALWTRWRERSALFDAAFFRKAVFPASLALNVALLLALTPAYPRKGLIEPLRTIERRNSSAHILFMQPGMKTYIPFNYASEDMKRFYLRNWSDMALLRSSLLTKPPYDFVALYPRADDDTNLYLDSAESVLGTLRYEFTIEPSFYDALLHKLNPRHNPDFRAVVYSTAGN